MIQFAENRHPGTLDPSDFSRDASADVRRLHRMVPGYAETPLVRLDALARRAGVGAVYVKDESARFGLKAFKGLGGVYAMFRIACQALGLDPAETTLRDLAADPCRRRLQDMVFATTTDGNHGKGVSWAAGLLGAQARVFMPRGTVPVRAQAIRDAGSAVVEITGMRYDDCVAWTRAEAERQGWILIQDTGGGDVPRWIMRGYTTLLFEAAARLPQPPTHLFLQAGVGAMAGAVAAAAVAAWPEKPPVIATVEPESVACFYESFAAGDGLPHPATGSGETIMAGLNCAVPCPLAWEILSGCAAGGLACDDDVTRRGMRLLAEAGVISGESGAVTAGLVEALSEPENRAVREALQLDARSIVLVINTEGDTDPENYARVLQG